MDAAREIQNLISTYALLVDDADFDGLGALMSDCRLIHGDHVVEGGKAIATLGRNLIRLYEGGSPRTQHVTTNFIIEVDEGDGHASALSYFTVFQAAPGFPLQPIVFGRYADRFEKFEAGWRFVERRVRHCEEGDLSHHQMFASG